MNNKIILRVKKDKVNNWYYFGKKNLRLQLAGDPRRGQGYWIEQYADKALGIGGRDRFMTDLTKILHSMEIDNAEIFSLYEMPEVIHGNIG